MILQKMDNYIKMKNPTQNKCIAALIFFSAVILTVLVQI